MRWGERATGRSQDAEETLGERLGGGRGLGVWFLKACGNVLSVISEGEEYVNEMWKRVNETGDLRLFPFISFVIIFSVLLAKFTVWMFFFYKKLMANS